MKTKTGYCPICDKDITTRGDPPPSCPICGHHVVYHEATRDDGGKLNDMQRMLECLFCPYMDKCIETVEDVSNVEHPDGSCALMDVFAKEVNLNEISKG